MFAISSCNLKKNGIALTPYDGFDHQMTMTIQSALSSTFNQPVYILPAKDIPRSAFVNIKTPRYRAEALLIDLKNNKPDSIAYMLGLTNEDISTTKRDEDGNVLEPAEKYQDWGIFGLAYTPGSSCVVSTFRIKDKDHELFIERLTKICIHEIGHNYGLDHCSSDKCIMNDAAETIKTIDWVDAEFCTNCIEKI